MEEKKFKNKPSNFDLKNISNQAKSGVNTVKYFGLTLESQIKPK